MTNGFGTDGGQERPASGAARKRFGRGWFISGAAVLSGIVLIGAWGLSGRSSNAALATPGPATVSAPSLVTKTSSTTAPAAPKVTQTAYGDWVMRCSSAAGSAQKTCELNQFLQNEKKQLVAEIAIGRAPGQGNDLRLVVVLPDNVALQTPVRAADAHDNGFDLSFERCLPSGCFASAVFSGAVVNQWRAESGLGHLAFKDGVNNSIAWPFSLRGLSSALDALRHENGSSQ
ncbi:invasion associated locus B family protein [Acidocella sp.]|uniref:invasion associated locus B family protein n=1 Tax=Acidocella sp. TaxID=50710 RepID=UPI0026198A61|nr:invasion associated locus B family protein [Acidocella sp.]